MSTENLEYKNLIDEIISLIGDAKYQAVSYANSSLTILFWHIGKRIITHNLGNERAAYGKQIVVTLSRELTNRFGRNYEEKNVRRMIQFAQLFPDFENVVTMSRYLSWSHFLALIPLKDSVKIDFYGKLACESLCGVRELRTRAGGCTASRWVPSLI